MLWQISLHTSERTTQRAVVLDYETFKTYG
jgi:hypothetical protein